MNIFNWNVQGLESSLTFREAQKLLQMQKPKLVFLCKTKLTARQMRENSQWLNLECCFEVKRTWRWEGFALMWNSKLMVDIKSWSKHHIDAVVCVENISYWRNTWIYGHPKMSQKHYTWTLLKRLASLSSLPWLCFGDFNEILWPGGKIGGK